MSLSYAFLDSFFFYLGLLKVLLCVLIPPPPKGKIMYLNGTCQSYCMKSFSNGMTVLFYTEWYFHIEIANFCIFKLASRFKSLVEKKEIEINLFGKHQVISATDWTNNTGKSQTDLFLLLSVNVYYLNVHRVKCIYSNIQKPI